MVEYRAVITFTDLQLFICYSWQTAITLAPASDSHFLLTVGYQQRGVSLERVYNRSAVAYRGGVWGVQTPTEILKALQNRAKLNPIVKTVKNC